jgi:hypothetical protein
MVLGEGALESAQGASEQGGWPSTPFQSAALLPFTADLDLTFASVGAGLFGEIEDAHAQANVAKDGIRLSEVRGKLHGGELTGLFEVKNNDGSGLVSTQFKLAGTDLAEVLTGSRLSGKADISASLSAAGKTVEALFASLSGSGSASVKELKAPGINPDAFPALLAGADTFGRSIDAIRTAAFAPPIVSDGSFVAPPADIAFTVAAGVLRAPPVTFPTDKVAVSSDLKLEFKSGTVLAAGSATYAAGDEALVGSEPSVGFTVEGPVTALTGRYDTEPLAQFLTQRALEREQARVEALQSSLIEKQRLRREVRYYASLQFERDQAAEALRKAEEEARRAAEERRKAEEAAKAAEEKRRAEEAARAAEEKRKQDEEARRNAEEEKRKADEAAQVEELRRAEEAAKAAAEEERRRAKDEARRKAEEATRLAAEEAAKRKTSRASVERAPLDPVGGLPPEPEPTGKLKPFSIDSFLDSLQSSQ